jgi:hypothetical protein
MIDGGEIRELVLLLRHDHLMAGGNIDVLNRIATGGQAQSAIQDGRSAGICWGDEPSRQHFYVAEPVIETEPAEGLKKLAAE